MKSKKYLIFLLCIIFPVMIAATYTVDNSETGSLVNSLGGTWVTIDDGYSSVTFTPNDTPAYAGTYSRLMDWTIKAGNISGAYASIVTSLNSGWTNVDLSAYSGIRFYVKGAGGYSVALATNQTKITLNHYTAPFNPTSTWQQYEIPFSSLTQLWGTAKPWEPSTIYSIVFTSVSTPGNSGQLRFDNIEFYTAAEANILPNPNVIILEPKINMLGYLPNEKKYFYVVTNTAAVGDTYKIFDANGNTSYAGTLSGLAVNDIATTGEGVWKVDFSNFKTIGTYHISINNKDSFHFKIADDVYDGLFKDSLRCFYLIRCGIGINDEVTGLSRNACHLSDAITKDTAVNSDFTGGWHNAGDYGKWCHMEAISSAWFMWLYEMKTANMKNFKNNILESTNSMSDLLNEAKWGLDFLFKLQNTDGSVYHKVDTEGNFCWGTKPDMDPFTRYAAFQKIGQLQIPSTIDAADFSAVMAQASRVFDNIDSDYSIKCRQAAIKAWEWVVANSATGQTDPYYTDASSTEEVLWAKAEMFRLTGDTNLSTTFSSDIDSHILENVSWATPEFFGYFSITQDSKTPQALKDKVVGKITTLGDSFVTLANNSGYNRIDKSFDYFWGSNEDLMNRADCLLMAYSLTGNSGYKDTALNQLSFILGANSINTSYVTKEGENSAAHPYNWIFYDYGILMPGWASGGPNHDISGADALLINLINKGTPMAKCWLDTAASNGSYASNEGQTSENAALVFLSGFFFSEIVPDVPVPEVPKSNLNEVKAYPSPCDLRMNNAGITFTNLTEKTKISIYSLSGELIYKDEADTPEGKYFWKLKPAIRSKAIANGIYIYVIKGSNGQVVKGKIAIIR